jgi:hypothetical protein
MNMQQTVTAIRRNVINTLLITKPGIKINETLEASLDDAILAALPEAKPTRLTQTQRDMINGLVGFNAGILLDTVSDDIVIHVPSCQKADKTGMDKDAPLIPAQSFTFTLPSYDNLSVGLFAIALDNVWSRLNFDKSQAELDNLYRYKLVSEAIPMLLGNLPVKTSSTKAGKDYPAIVRGFELDFLLSINGLTFDSHNIGEGKTGIGLTAVIANDNTDAYGDTIDALEGHLLQDKKKTDLFTYTTPAGQRYDVIASDVTERRKITATRYQFKQSKV